MNKLDYVKPASEIVELDAADVVVTSADWSDNGAGGGGRPGGGGGGRPGGGGGGRPGGGGPGPGRGW